MLIWNKADERVAPSTKSVGTYFLGTAVDSLICPSEYLMIMFYDILLLDDTVCIRESYDKRRGLLKSLVYCTRGRADIGTSEAIDSSVLSKATMHGMVDNRDVRRANFMFFFLFGPW